MRKLAIMLAPFDYTNNLLRSKIYIDQTKMNSDSEGDFYYPEYKESFKGNHDINTSAISLETFPGKNKYEFGRIWVLGLSFFFTTS